MIIPNFLRLLRSDPITWPLRFRQFISKIRQLPVYAAIPEVDLVQVVALVVKREISFDELRQRAGKAPGESEQQDIGRQEGRVLGNLREDAGEGNQIVKPATSKQVVQGTQQGETTTRIDPKLILSPPEIGMLGRLITYDVNWRALLREWNKIGITADDEQYSVVQGMVGDLIREEQREGRDPYRFLRLVMIKIFSFADSDLETRQAIIQAQEADLARFLFELFLPFSREDVRFLAKEFNDSFVSPLRQTNV